MENEVQETEVKKVKQKVAVRDLVNRVSVPEGQTAKEFLSSKTPEAKAARATVTTELLNGFKAGSVGLSDKAKAKYDTDAKLKKYCSGLISNWLKKDKDLQ